MCHFDVAYTGPGPLSCKTATQISNPPIRLPFIEERGGGRGEDGDCGLAGREIESSRIDVSSRTPPMQMHRSNGFLFSFYPAFSLVRPVPLSLSLSIVRFSFPVTFSRRWSMSNLSLLYAHGTEERSWKKGKRGRWLEQVTRTLTSDVVRRSC